MKSHLTFALFFLNLYVYAQVKIGDNPNTIDATSILEMEDTTRGVLFPRMTTTQRDSISSPPNGLEIYNISTNTHDIFSSDRWKSIAYKNRDENMVYVYSLDDLPSPSGSSITLDPSSVYIFRGIVDISPYYLELNGANLLGIDPARDGVASTVGGGILRSSDVSMFIQNFATVPLSGSTQAYDFQDNTGTKYCNLFSGTSVVEVGIPSLGVGQIKGFRAVTITKNFWDCTDGLKVGGTMGKFASAFNFITNISSGSGIEFLNDLNVDDVDLSNNYFIYNGQTGLKVGALAQIDRGRLTTNMFRGVGITELDGVTSNDVGWYMSQNTNISNTQPYGYIYMNANTAQTITSPNNTFVKINGTTTSLKLLKFESNTANRLTYKGKENLVASVFITITGSSPANSADFSLAISKNGTVITNPHHRTGSMVNNQVFTLVLETLVDLSKDDYIEAVIRTTSNHSPITITDLQFRVKD